MARIPLYQQNTSVSSVQTGRGSYMGEALKALGNAGVSALERYNQIQDEKQKDLIYTAASKARGEWSAKMAEMYSKAPAGATGVHEQLTQEFNNFVAEQEGQVPEGQRELYKRLMTDVGSQLTVVSMENTINARSQQAKQNFETSMNDDMNFIMQSPVAYEGIIAQAEARIDSNSLINGDIKNQLKEQVRQKYANATIQGLVNQGKFSEAKKLVNDGTLDKYIAADAKARSADFIADAERIEVNNLITEQRRIKAELEAKDNETLVNIYAQPENFSTTSLLELRNKGELSDEGYIKAVKELNRATSAKIEGVRNARALEDLEIKARQEENYKSITVQIEKGMYDDMESRAELLNRLDKEKDFLGESQFSKVLNSLKSRGKDTGKTSTEEELYKDVFKNYKDYTPERISSLEGVSSSTRTQLFNIAESLRKKEEAKKEEETTVEQRETFDSLNIAIAEGQFKDPEARKTLYKSMGDGTISLSSTQINQIIGKLSVKETTDKYTMEETELLSDVMINPKDWSDDRIAESIKSGNLSLAAGEKAFAIKNKRLNAMSKDVTTSDYVQLLGNAYKGDYRGKDASAKLWSDLNSNVYNLKPNEAAQILRAVKNSQGMSPFLSQAVSKINMQAKGILFEQGPFGVIATEDSSQKMYNFSYIVNDTIAKATESGMSEDDIIKVYFDPKSPKYLGNQISFVQEGGSMQGNNNNNNNNNNNTGTNNNQLNTTENESINIGNGSLTFED